MRSFLLALAAVVLVLVPDPAGAEVDPVGVWPLEPAPDVVRGFDPPDSPWGAGHRGVDLLGSLGQPVRAALPGTVRFAGMLAGRGVVVVDHGDTRTTYEPVVDPPAVGTPVTAGAVIGRLDTTGSHCLPRSCLHWGWRRGESYLDPLRLVGGGPLRLLPLGGLPTTGSAGWQPPVSTWRPVPTPWARWAPAASGAGMGLLVGLAQAVGGDVGVELGGGQ